jgi:hypothetical protein
VADGEGRRGFHRLRVCPRAAGDHIGGSQVGAELVGGASLLGLKNLRWRESWRRRACCRGTLLSHLCKGHGPADCEARRPCRHCVLGVFRPSVLQGNAPDRVSRDDRAQSLPWSFSTLLISFRL